MAKPEGSRPLAWVSKSELKIARKCFLRWDSHRMDFKVRDNEIFLDMISKLAMRFPQALTSGDLSGDLKSWGLEVRGPPRRSGRAQIWIWDLDARD